MPTEVTVSTGTPAALSVVSAAASELYGTSGSSVP